jgi:hypothetical protein
MGPKQTNALDSSGREMRERYYTINCEKERERERERERLINMLKYVTKGTCSMGPGNHMLNM